MGQRSRWRLWLAATAVGGALTTISLASALLVATLVDRGGECAAGSAPADRAGDVVETLGLTPAARLEDGYVFVIGDAVDGSDGE